MKRLLLTTVAALALWTSAANAATHRITLDPGGSIGQRIETLNQWRFNHDRVIVDGLCLSACTLITALIPDERVCITPRAVFGFHSAHFASPYGERVFAKEATRLIWQMYPKRVRDLLFEYGWEGPVDHDALVYVPANRLYSLCAPEDIDPYMPEGPTTPSPDSPAKDALRETNNG